MRALRAKHPLLRLRGGDEANLLATLRLVYQLEQRALQRATEEQGAGEEDRADSEVRAEEGEDVSWPRCGECGGKVVACVDSRPYDEPEMHVRRRYKCRKCKRAFGTVEIFVGESSSYRAMVNRLGTIARRDIAEKVSDLLGFVFSGKEKRQ